MYMKIKVKHLGRISDEVHAAIMKAAEESYLTVDEFLWILVRNWNMAREK